MSEVLKFVTLGVGLSLVVLLISTIPVPPIWAVQTRNGTNQDFLNPTRPVNFKIIAGRPVFLQEVFVPCSMYVIKKFQKGGGMGEVLKFVTLGVGLSVFCKNNSILRPLLVKFGFE